MDYEIKQDNNPIGDFRGMGYDSVVKLKDEKRIALIEYLELKLKRNIKELISTVVPSTADPIVLNTVRVINQVIDDIKKLDEKTKKEIERIDKLSTVSNG